MPISGLNLGKDVTLNIVTSTGVLRIKGRKSFSSRQITKSLDHTAADGDNKFAELPAGWEGDIEVDRSDDALDSYIAAWEAAYYAGAVIDSPNSITETITNPDGSISQYRYTKVVFKYSDAGKKSGESFISQKLDWKAAKRLKVA
jgi:hypothetical protein